MIFRLLGDLEVLIDGQDLRLAGHKQRALLAVLLLHANEVVGADRLIEDLWGDEPPAQAAKSVQVHVWRLRKALGAETADSDADGRVLTRASGYVLRVDRGELDVQEFERLVDEGSKALRDGQPERAGGLLREGLALWRGPPLAEFAYDAFARQEIERLSELHSQAIQGRIDADLALGRHDLLVGELEALVAAHPLAERLRGQLMLALYRCGTPGRRTRGLPADTTSAAGRPRARTRQRPQTPARRDPQPRPRARTAAGRRPVLAARDGGNGGCPRSASGAAVGSAGSGPSTVGAARRRGAPAQCGGSGRGRNPRDAGGGAVIAAANSVAVIDPGDNRVVTQTPVGAGPGSITAGIGGVWVANTDDHTIMTLDVASRQVTRTMGFRDSVDGVAADSRALWTVDSTRGIAQRIDPPSGRLCRTVPVGDRAGSGSIPNAWRLAGTRYGLRTTRPESCGSPTVAPASRGSTSATSPAESRSGAVRPGWLTTSTTPCRRIDSTGGISKIIPVGPGASGIVVGAGAVWVASTLDDRLERIDPTTNSVTTTIRVGSRPRGVAWGDGSIWVANSGDGTISRVDPGTDRVRRIAVGQSPQAIVVTGGAVWVSVAARAGAGASPAEPHRRTAAGGGRGSVRVH